MIESPEPIEPSQTDADDVGQSPDRPLSNTVQTPNERGKGRVTVLCGGFGAARFLRGLKEVHPGHQTTAIVNTADDMVLHGLHISPDIDTCIYTLADAINPETGWGLIDETWHALENLERYGGQTWFGLGDRDLGTHLYRTQRLSEGARLGLVTSEIAQGWGIATQVVPMSEEPVGTKVTIANGDTIDFQRYFVERGHRDRVKAVAFEGVEVAGAGPGVVEAIQQADVVVIAPSNPIVSIGPLIAVNEIREALAARTSPTVAISPIVGGAAIKGPAAQLMADLDHEPSATGVAALYRPWCDHMVIHNVDLRDREAIRAMGYDVTVTDTMMTSVAAAARLSEVSLSTATKGEPTR